MPLDSTTIIVVVVVFAVVILAAILFFRRRIEAKINAPGLQMSVKAENERQSKGKQANPTVGTAIRGNFSIGQTKIDLKNEGVIDNNKFIGETDIKVDGASTDQNSEPKSKNKK